MFHRSPSPKLVKVRVFSSEQKSALFDIMKGFLEKPKLLSYTKSYIDYTILFNYSANFSSFMYEYRGLYPKYKFKILSYRNYEK